MATDYEPDDVLLSHVYEFTAPDNRPVRLNGRALLTCLQQLEWLAETRPPEKRIVIDPWGVGFSATGDRLRVHLPNRDAAGNTTYGAGVPFDHEPELARDGIRAAFFRQLLAADA